MAYGSRYSKNGHRRRTIRARLMASTDRCALCGGEIDKSLKTPDPMSPEVDEIIPVSLGGDPLDIKNCQLVHRICNQRKGNKLYADVSGRQQVPATPIQASQDWTQ